MFEYKGNIKSIKEATAAANELFYNSHFTDTIAAKESFDMSTAKPSYIATSIRNTSNVKTNVKTYRSRNPWSRAIAYFTANRPNDINLNTRKLNRTKGSIVATLWHERIHQLDNLDPVHYYGHGNNSPRGKQNTAPYWIDNLAQSIIDKKLDHTNNESRNIVYVRRSFLNRFTSSISRFFRRVF